jgi:hypothetical protein
MGSNALEAAVGEFIESTTGAIAVLRELDSLSSQHCAGALTAMLDQLAALLLKHGAK